MERFLREGASGYCLILELGLSLETFVFRQIWPGATL